MDYIITNLIDELLWQLQDVDGWIAWNVLMFMCFGTALAQYAGKYAALRENDKALNPIANAFYEGAQLGIRETWFMGDALSISLALDAAESLYSSRKKKRAVWA